MFKKILALNAYYRIILFAFIIFIAVFQSFRIIFMLVNIHLLDNASMQLIFTSIFNRGLLFDAVVACYISTFPFAISLIPNLAGIIKKWFASILVIYYLIVLNFILLVILSDFPYFNYYNSRITWNVFNWTDNVFLMFKAIFTDQSYILYIALFAVFSFLTIKLFWQKFKKLKQNKNFYRQNGIINRITYFLICSYLLFIGIRGDYRIKKMPIQAEDAFITEHAFINQAGLNPVFNFIHSAQEANIRYFKEDITAVNLAQKYLQIKPEFASPIARQITASDTPTTPNIIIILMESMSAAKMGYYGNTNNLTPFLDSLTQKSIFFPNTYTAGIHTFNGIFSTLYGLPALLQNKITKSSQTASLQYYGLPNILKEKNYQTVYICSGEKEFDNLHQFLPNNGFDNIIDVKYFPSSEIINGWGVSDHIMFDYSFEHLNKLAKNNKPFFATFMTISTHSPFTVPTNIDLKYTAKNDQDKSYQYADWALQQFFKKAQTQAWYKNTLFVLIADHGQNFDATYEIALPYHHSPLIFYWQNKIQAQSIPNLALQIDVFPTILGIIHQPYINNSLGINLLSTTRPYAFFSSDSKIGCLNNNYFLIITQNGKETLFDYKNKDTKNLIANHTTLADSMKSYTYSMLQTTQYLIRQKLTGKNATKKRQE